MNDHDFEAELKDLVQSGQKIEAIRRYRDRTGAGLAEAKAAVERLAEGVSEAVRDSPESGDLTAEVVVLLGRGEKIQAIKLVRSHTGYGLKEAKDLVDKIGAENGLLAQRGSGCLGVFLSVVCAVGIAAGLIIGIHKF